MMTRMNAAEFYAVVRREIGPLLKARGFRRSSNDIGLAVYPRAGMWIKPLPQPGPVPAPDRLIVSFDHSTWGWLSGLGGEFRVYLEVGGCANIVELLADGQRRELTGLTQGVIARIQRQPGARHDLLRGRERAVLDPRIEGFVPYWNEADIVAYTSMFVPWLPELAARLGDDPALAEHFALSDAQPR